MSIPTSSQRSPSPEDEESRVPGTTLEREKTTVNVDVTGKQSGINGASTVGSAPIPGIGSPGLITGRMRDVWRLITGNRKVTFGMSIVVIFLLIAIFGPLFIHTDPNALSSDVLLPPSAHHWLGTTQTGQDIFAQLVIGTRSSVIWGFVTGIVVTIVSIVLGLTAGYFGGMIDDIIMLADNVFLILPGLVLAIVLAAYLPFKGSLTITFVLVITGWAYGARVLRSQTLSLRKRDFVDAAKASGESTGRIMFAEILPNMISLVVAAFIGAVIYNIGAAAALEFLGLGDATDTSWGIMLFWAQNNEALLVGAWWWFVPPGFCLALLAGGLAFINYGIDEIANPRLHKEAKAKNIVKKNLIKEKAIA